MLSSNILLSSGIAASALILFNSTAPTAPKMPSFQECPSRCTPGYTITAIPPDWTIGALGSPGTGSEECVTCVPCNIAVTWSYSPSELTRYKVTWPVGQGVRGAAGGAAGTADGGFNYDVTCNLPVAAPNVFEDHSGGSANGVPECPCDPAGGGE